MKTKKILSFLAAAAISASAFAGLAVTASAATVDDLQPITESCTFISQNETTAALTKDSLSWDGKLLTLNGDNGYSTSKGNSTFNGTTIKNLLQLKQGRNMAIKVAVPCTVDVYHDLNGTRTVQAGTTNKGTDITVTATSYETYQVDSFAVENASAANPVTVYLGASGDVYVAAIDVKTETDTPTPPVTTYQVNVDSSVETLSYAGGYVTASPTTAKAGDKVTVTPIAYDHYRLKSLKYNDTAIEAQDGVYSFTMPEADVNIIAEFERTDDATVLFFGNSTPGGGAHNVEDQGIYSLSYVKSGASATFNNVVLKDDAKQLDSITIYASSPNPTTPTMISFNGGTVQSLAEGTEVDSSKPGNKYYTYYGKTLKYNGSYEGTDLEIEFTSESTGYIGNYWYVALNYVPVSEEPETQDTVYVKATSTKDTATTFTGVTLKLTDTEDNKSVQAKTNTTITITIDPNSAIAIAISDIPAKYTVNSVTLD